ncbi:MAG: Ppx/GppA family phosphatase [Verrucomicrobia bacterium]|nr:MAG: Ppx/GppA family phosphatase [Verrucomicrobiota bacterium]
MSNVRRAVIDVGTNSVKLLVAEVNGRSVEPVLEDGKQTRLGKGFYETHRLQPVAIAQTALAVGEFFKAAKKIGARDVRVIATSAARDAENPGDLIAAVQKACGLRLEVISGEQEAEWAFRGAMSNPKLSREPVLLLDVGGGSTEFILGQRDELNFRHSYRLGAVRLMERVPHGDPPEPEDLSAGRSWLWNYLYEEVRPMLEPALKREVKKHAQHHAVRLVGVGGTASVLARIENKMDDYDRERIEATRLSMKQVSGWCERLWSVPLAERRKIPGIPKERADVLLTGMLIYEAVMREFDFPELRVSTRGLRFAAVMDNA